MDTHLQAGVGIYNTGRYHAAHDAWEDRWLDLESGTDDERFLHGLIQFTAAVHHADTGNRAGATGLADSARGYLDGLDPAYRGVNVGSVRRYLDALGRDPGAIEDPLALTYDGAALELDDLGFEATAIAAAVLAEADGHDETLFEAAATYARADLDDGRTASPFVTLLFDFVREPDDRGIVTQRLSEHTQRRQHRDEDVTGLFEER